MRQEFGRKQFYAIFLMIWHVGLAATFLVAGLGYLPMNLTQFGRGFAMVSAIVTVLVGWSHMELVLRSAYKVNEKREVVLTMNDIMKAGKWDLFWESRDLDDWIAVHGSVCSTDRVVLTPSEAKFLGFL